MELQQQSSTQVAGASSQQQIPASQPAMGVSNADRLGECDLDSAPTDEACLFDDFGALILDCVPMEIALPMAVGQIEKPGVQQWVLEQDGPRMVQAMARVLPEKLLAQWPVGTGVFVKGAGKVAALLGAGLDGEIELVHAAPGQLRAKAQARGTFGLETLGAALKVEGGGERALLEQSLGGSLAVEMGITGTCLASLDAGLLMTLGATLPPVAMLQILAGSRVVDLAAGAVGLDLPTVMPMVDWSLEKRAALVSKVGLTSGQEAPDLSPVDLAQTMAELAPYLESLNQLYRGSFSGRVELLHSGNQLSLNLCTTLAAVAELRTLNIFTGTMDIAALEQLAAELKHQGELSFSAGVKLVEGRLLASPHGRASLKLGSGYDDASKTDELHFFLDQIPAFLARLREGQGLEAMLAGAGIDRTVELPAPRELVSQVVPELVTATADMAADNGLAAGWEDFNLVGKLSLGPDVLGRLVGEGLRAPEGMSMLQAVDDVQSALCALVCGLKPEAAWLAPWELALRKAVAGVPLPAPRLVGKVAFGLGFGASVTGGGSVGGAAKGSAGMVVDREVGQVDSGPLRKALAGLCSPT